MSKYNKRRDLDKPVKERIFLGKIQNCIIKPIEQSCLWVSRGLDYISF